MDASPGAAAGGAEAPSSSPSASVPSDPSQPLPQQPSRYESQKRRDWNTFLQYLRNHKPPLNLPRCSGAHVIEFLKYLDQFGKTKVHAANCSFYGNPTPPAPCACPLRQAWGSLDALIGRLRAAYEESGGRPDANPFAARAVRIYLREVRDVQAKARGIPYAKKKRKRAASAIGSGPGESSSTAAAAGGGGTGAGEGGSSSSRPGGSSPASELAPGGYLLGQVHKFRIEGKKGA